MKKNILLVPSLLALSVATTSVLGMENYIEYKEKQPTSQGKNKKQKRQLEKAQPKKIQNTQRQIVEDHEHYQIERNNTIDVMQNPFYNHPEVPFQSLDELFAELNDETTQENTPSTLIASETETIDVALPERAALTIEQPTVLVTQNSQKPYRTYEVQQIKTTAQAASDFPEARKNHVFSYDPNEAIKESELYQERTKIENSPVLDIKKEDIAQTAKVHSQNEITKITPKSYVSAEDLQKSPLYNRNNPDKQSQNIIELPTIALEQPTATVETEVTIVDAQDSSVQSETTVAETTESNPLFQSVMMPTAKKELDYWTRLNTRLFNVISNIKSFLQNKTYDVENAEYLEMLHAALTQARETDDFDTIIKLAELCQSTEDYKNKIRINDEIATSALELLTNKYNAAVACSNIKINNMYDTHTRKYDDATTAFAYTLSQAPAAYLKNIKGISEEAATQYATAREQEESRIKGIQESITTFSKLNGSIRPKVTELLQQNIQAKENNIAEHCAQSEELVKSLLGLSEKMPKMNLQLTNK